jgi:kynureninase
MIARRRCRVNARLRASTNAMCGASYNSHTGEAAVSSLASDPLLGYREQFPILARTNYLISNSLGAVPVQVSDSLHAYYRLWAERGVRAWEDAWWTMAIDLGNLVAPLIGARAGDVAFQPTVTLAHAVIFSAFEFHGHRPKIVTDDMHFPSVRYLIAEQSRLGAVVVTVPSEDGITVDTGRLIKEIDEKTALVNISHVLFKSAYIHDIAAIAHQARQAGAFMLVDGYQAVGTIPVDVAADGVDGYIGGCLKWLCGGPGAAFLWVRPECRPKLSPRLTGWMAHARPFDFTGRLERRDDIGRFFHGTPSIPALYAARPGLEIINAIGIDAIRAKSMRQTARLLALANARGYRCTAPGDAGRRAGTVAFDIQHGYEVSQALKERHILCDYRPGAGIRLSPHFYTKDEELDSAVEAIADILHTESWRNFGGSRNTVT